MTKTDEKSSKGDGITARQPTAVLGTLEPFDVERPGEWVAYLERFDLFCLTNGLLEDKMRAAMLMTVGGKALYDVAASVVSPGKVKDATFKVLVEKLSSHFVPTRTVWSARFEFFRRAQGPDEPATCYMAALQKLASDCKFEALLDSMLITQFICGLREEAVQRRLLLEKEGSLTKEIALETAKVSESTKEQQRGIREEKIHAVRSNYTPKEEPMTECSRCGARHGGQCKYRDAVCHSCKKTGHLAKMCTQSKATPHSGGGFKNRKWNGRRQGGNGRSIKNVCGYGGTAPEWATVAIGKGSLKLEVDSGSPYTIMSMRMFRNLLPKHPLRKRDRNITDYQGGRIVVKGETQVDVEYNGRKICDLPVVVVDCDATPLLGRNWFEPLGITLRGVHAVRSEPTIKDLLEQYKEVFDESLGCYKGPPVKLELKDDVPPVALPPRSVPMALREAVEKELNKLQAQGILTRIEYADWATPIVPVKKSDGSLRICGDYKATVNRAIKSHAHKVPSINDLLSRVDGGVLFAKMDMSQAYQQLTVDEETARVQAITTHKGTFAVNRLQFGVAAAPGIFQSLMERLVGGLEGILPYLDDIIVYARTEGELIEKVRALLAIFAENGLRLKKEKCVFRTMSLDFLGHRVTADGISPLKDKVEPIKRAPYPRNKKELQATLGMIGFYQPFLPDKATIAEPLHRLLDKDRRWSFDKEHREAVDKLKDLLTSDKVLVHYSLQRPVAIVADASPYGCGGVLFHIMEDGTERPVAFYSRTLSKAERNYSQLDREAVAIVSTVKKFHDFLYGREFKIFNDHRPLLGILGKGPCPAVISPTMLRRRIFLSAYDAELVYRPAAKMGNADFLSRSPLEDERVNFIDHRMETPVLGKELVSMTRKDELLQRVIKWTREGWPTKENKVPEDVIPFFRKREELSIERECLVWGNRVVIPEKARAAVMEMLHIGHPGVVRMKTLARQHVYWPGIDKAIELSVGKCKECQEVRNEPAKVTHPWEAAEGPWSRVHIDHAGPFRGKLYLIVVDSFSKWLDVTVVPSTAAKVTVRVLRRLFAEFGLPDTVVSDNGTGFSAGEFKNFCHRNGVQHYQVAPYMPSSNGVAERNVQTVKNFLKKLEPNADVEVELASFLLSHRTTRLSCGKSPAEMLMGRQLKTCLDNIRPPKKRSFKQGKFQEYDPVWVRQFRAGGARSWGEGVVRRQVGHRVYEVELLTGSVQKRHDHQLRARVNCDDLWPEREAEEESEYEDAVEEPIEETTEPLRRSSRNRKQTSCYGCC